MAICVNTQLISDWTIEAAAPPAPDHLRQPFPVTVPGSAHSALIAHGEIDDLTRTGREQDQRWVARTPWIYRAKVRRPAHPYERAALVFHGIDTVAVVSVDGVERLRAANMFRSYEIDLTEDFAAREQLEVAVAFTPAVEVAAAADALNPLPRPSEYVDAYNQLRKMACSFGWDWGPNTATCGLWQQVELKSWIGARLLSLDVRAGLGRHPRVGVAITLAGSAAAVAVEVVDAAGTVHGGARADVVDGAARCDLDVPAADLWWPAGEGAQPLYDVLVTLIGVDGQPAEHAGRRVGFRTVELVQQADARGRSFELHVNGRRVWVRGVNWIPDDIFPERVTAARYRERLTQATEAGCNFVRVWGGGRYEADGFYDSADELGLLVMQDFLFACAAYPEDGETKAEVVAEATEAITRLRHRASLALWCGGNENLWGYVDWNWQDVLGGRPWGAGYYHEVLPALVGSLDDRPYIPGSPFSPDGRHPNSPDAGTMHLWDVWNTLDYAHYEDAAPRFAAEFGYQGPATWPTLLAAIDGNTLDPTDPALLEHQKAADGPAKLQAGLDRHFPHPPADGVGWYFAGALTQARAVARGINHFRSLGDECGGAIYWQLNDCWPAISWSVVDSRGRRKLAWYALRASFAARLLVITMTDGRPTLVALNDTDEPWYTTAAVQAVLPSGADSAEQFALGVAPRSSTRLTLPAPPGAQLVVVDVDGHRATRWLIDDLAVDLPAHDVDVSSVAGPGWASVTVRARGLARDVCLLAELALPDAVVEPQLVTLLAGETVTFAVTWPAGVDASVAWADLVWTDNRLRDMARVWASADRS